MTPRKFFRLVLKGPHDRHATGVVEQGFDRQHTTAHPAFVDAAVGYAMGEDVVGVNPSIAGTKHLSHARGTT